MINNKGAMFGLEARVLKKQFGELFLARLRRLTFRLVEGQQATGVQTSKGAMFGLDARIALAIFGALSVISGAALYSAIQHSKIIATVTEMQEVNKAVEQYLLDTGSDIEKTGTAYYFKIENLLVDSGAVGWNGPYMPWEDSLMSAGSKSIYFAEGGSDTGTDFYYSLNFFNGNDWDVDASCPAGDPCYYYTRAGVIPDALADAIDLYADGTVDGSIGKIRTTLHSVGHKNVYLQGPLMLNQP
ncbi:MAG TPA: hypothetical protein DCL21_06735 [Alphaproteobacteria bacterium]|nr:hypothetical protein [Alphaproteobacteria bacterium]